MQRYEIINHLIQKFNYKTYLEIGTQFGKSFEQINLPRQNKTCIDINNTYTDLNFVMSSNDFFEQNKNTFDIIFVDGDHSYEQSYVDVLNSLKVLNSKGAIVCHDCYPPEEACTHPHSMGTVYKTIVRLVQERPDLFIVTVNSDCGCAIIRQCAVDVLPTNLVDESTLEYSKFIQNPQKYINLISPETFKQMY